jgi:hypothetical protein
LDVSYSGYLGFADGPPLVLSESCLGLMYLFDIFSCNVHVDERTEARKEKMSDEVHDHLLATKTPNELMHAAQAIGG